MQKERLNPEEVLQKVKLQEKNKTKGQLKIFIGAAAGVGKTYAMIKEAIKLKAEHLDVVFGYIEPHGRQDIIQMLPDNIEYIPLKLVEYKGKLLHEFDVDATLKRNPQIVIVDELAHTNVAFSRNAKRYQDVEELLNAGINVYTALNIQHIESLNDIAYQITEVKVSETVPDQIIEAANDIVVIDIPPDELIERLKEGKIYPKDQIQSALNNFFRKGNLTALRELVLRKAAKKVNQQVLAYRSDKDITNVWPSNNKLLLVIEPGYFSEKIIRAAKNASDNGFDSWYVGYVENNSFDSKSLNEKQEIINLIELAKSLGAESVEIIGTDPALAISQCLVDNNINTLMLAQYRLPLYYKLFGKSLAERITELLPEINVNLVNYEHENVLPQYTKKIKYNLNISKTFQKLVYLVIAFSLIGVVLQPLTKILSNENILMLYLLAIVIVNQGRGRISAILTALVATVSFDFFFVPPHFTFSVINSQYLITFGVLAVIGTLISTIAGDLRYQVSQLSKQARLEGILNSLSQALAISMAESQVIKAVFDNFGQMFQIEYMMLLSDPDKELQLKLGTTLNNYDVNITKWVFKNNQSAGLNTNTFATSKLLYYPITTKTRPYGVFIIKPKHSLSFFLPASQKNLEMFVTLLANTLERIHFLQVALQTEIALAQK